MFSDAQLDAMRAVTKTATGRVRTRTHKQSHVAEVDLTGADGRRYLLIARQSVRVGNGFSCLVQVRLDGRDLNLARYNGSDHPHTNRLDGTRLRMVCHVHTATARYIDAGLTAEGHAEATTRYTDLAGAALCCLRDLHVQGVKVEALVPRPDQMSLLTPGAQ